MNAEFELEELGEDDLMAVRGGLPNAKGMSSKVCDVGGGCWPDTDFGSW